MKRTTLRLLRARLVHDRLLYRRMCRGHNARNIGALKKSTAMLQQLIREVRNA